MLPVAGIGGVRRGEAVERAVVVLPGLLFLERAVVVLPGLLFLGRGVAIFFAPRLGLFALFALIGDRLLSWRRRR